MVHPIQCKKISSISYLVGQYPYGVTLDGQMDN